MPWDTRESMDSGCRATSQVPTAATLERDDRLPGTADTVWLVPAPDTADFLGLWATLRQYSTPTA